MMIRLTMEGMASISLNDFDSDECSMLSLISWISLSTSSIALPRKAANASLASCSPFSGSFKRLYFIIAKRGEMGNMKMHDATTMAGYAGREKDQRKVNHGC